MSGNNACNLQVHEARSNSLSMYDEEATANIMDSNESHNSSFRDGNTDAVIRYYKNDYVDETPSVIRYYASDYASGCVLQTPSVMKYYQNDYASPNYLQIDRRQQETNPKNWSHGDTTNKIKPKVSRVSATASTLQSFKNKVLKIPYLRMK